MKGTPQKYLGFNNAITDVGSISGFPKRGHPYAAYGGGSGLFVRHPPLLPDSLPVCIVLQK